VPRGSSCFRCADSARHRLSRTFPWARGHAIIGASAVPFRPEGYSAILHKSLASLIVIVVPFLTIECSAADDVWIGHEATRSWITLIDVNGSSPKVVNDSPRRYAAPEWTADGAGLIVNGGGKLWRVAVSGGTPAPIPTGSAAWIDVNHAISPDGKSLAFTAGAIWKIPVAVGHPASITASPGNWVHSWSPDGKLLAFSSNRGGGLDLFLISPNGGAERRLATSPRADDAPQFSPDGRWVYFVFRRLTLPDKPARA
jgi:TolB protein